MLRITPEIEALIDRAISEDFSIGDPTTEALIAPDHMGEAVLIAKANGVLAGVDVALAIFERVDSELETEAVAADGAILSPGDVIARVKGRTSSILVAERTALNLLQRLSGIASQTNEYVRAVEGHSVRIVDTRKTTAGLRNLEKYAVRMGGGFNHRRNLGDGILIKDNHIQALRNEGLTLGDVVRKAYENASHTIKIEVEVENLNEVNEALDAGAQILLLDNMGVEEMALAVHASHGKAITEASGGITLSTVAAVASSGVDLISVGALTHSVMALDISLDLK